MEPECEVIIVGMKLDQTDNIKVQPKHIIFPRKKYCPYIALSCLQQVNNRAVMWYAALISHFVSNLKGVPETPTCNECNKEQFDFNL